jgi:hypothetical protein
MPQFASDEKKLTFDELMEEWKEKFIASRNSLIKLMKLNKILKEKHDKLLKIENLNKKQEITTLENCAICMEKFNIDDVIATPCKQCKIRAFHMECHAQAAEYSPHCPLCRYKN